MLYRLTKSKFILGLKCEKALYLDVYRPKLAHFAPETLKKFREGRLFETRIKSLFPNAIDLSLQLGRQINKYPILTSQLLEQEGEINIYEAGFVFNEVLVLADVVHKSANGEISVYEIKNSLSIKDVFINDLNLQYYVISHCVDNISSFSLVYNDGNDNPVYEERLKESQKAESNIAEKVERFKDVIQGFEPDIKPGDHCGKPYDCPYRHYCEKNNAALLEFGNSQ